MNREELHTLIDRLPDEAIPTVRRILKAILEGEELTEEELLAIREAEEDIEAGRTISLDLLMRELGIEG